MWRYRYAWLSARRRANNAQGSVVFWKQTAAGLEESRRKLAQWLEEERQQRVVSMGNLVESPPNVGALGSQDRRNVLRLTDENTRLREALEEAHRRAVELEKQLERNPS
jgi:hypothetical protein